MFTPHDRGYEVLSRCIKTLSRAPLLLDLGTPAALRKELVPFRPLFKRTRYVSLDRIATPPNADGKPHVRGDILRLPFRGEAVGAVIVKDVLEHVPDPAAAVREIRRVLQSGGRLLALSPWMHPYHGCDQDSARDFWRFSGDGLRELLRSFRDVEVFPLGGPLAIARNFLPAPVGRLAYASAAARLIGAGDRILATRHFCASFLGWARK